MSLTNISEMNPEDQQFKPYSIFVLLDLCLLRYTSDHHQPYLPYGVRMIIREYLYVPLNNNNIREAVQLWCHMHNNKKALIKYGHISFWDVSVVTNMSKLFRDKQRFDDNINFWDVSRVKDMSDMFHGARCFNKPLCRWNVSSVTTMRGMFYDCGFNQDVSTWNVSKVTNMEKMFFEAFNFNKPLNTWDVSNVRTMSGMFKSTGKFNQPLDQWNTGRVTTMLQMFSCTSHFNQPIENWNLGELKTTKEMFFKAGSFNQPLNNLRFSKKLKNVSYMFTYSQKFNQPLNNWNTKHINNMYQMFNHAHGMIRGSTIPGWLKNWSLPAGYKLDDLLYSSFEFANQANDYGFSDDDSDMPPRETVYIRHHRNQTADSDEAEAEGLFDEEDEDDSFIVHDSEESDLDGDYEEDSSDED